jgi:hypothetical protein
MYAYILYIHIHILSKEHIPLVSHEEPLNNMALFRNLYGVVNIWGVCVGGLPPLLSSRTLYYNECSWGRGPGQGEKLLEGNVDDQHLFVNGHTVLRNNMKN